MNNRRHNLPRKKRMPAESAVTREALRMAVFDHLAVIMPDSFDDEDLTIFTNVGVGGIEDMINYAPKKKELGVQSAKRNSQRRAKLGGLPVLDWEGLWAIDGLITLFEKIAEGMLDTPEYAPIVSEFLALTNKAKAWLEQQTEPAEPEPTP